jgi:host factor-I protein
MRNGPDSTAVVRAPEPESFGNRKLIRPSLNRAQTRVTEAATERRVRTARAPERVSDRAPDRGSDRTSERGSDRGSDRMPGVPSKKAAPAEQTHAEDFYYQKQMQGKTPMVVVTREGEELRGVIEWYDKYCLKLHRAGGQSNLLIYKTSIRYMFKEGEQTK